MDAEIAAHLLNRGTNRMDEFFAAIEAGSASAVRALLERDASLAHASKILTSPPVPNPEEEDPRCGGGLPLKPKPHTWQMTGSPIRPRRPDGWPGPTQGKQGRPSGPFNPGRKPDQPSAMRCDGNTGRHPVEDAAGGPRSRIYALTRTWPAYCAAMSVIEMGL